MLFDCPRVTNIFTPRGGDKHFYTKWGENILTHKGGTDIFRLKRGQTFLDKGGTNFFLLKGANIFRLKGGTNIFTQGGGTFSVVGDGGDNDVYGEEVVSETNILASKQSKLSAGVRILRGL